MLGEVVGAVVGSGPPVIFELLLGLAIAKPVETHVHGFRAARLDVVVDDAEGCAVVGFDRGFRLFVAHLFEKLAHGYGFAGVDVECAELRFGCTGHDGLEYFGDGVYCAIVVRVISVFGAEEVSSNSASCCCFAEVGGVAVYGENHVTLAICEDGIRVGCNVVE